MPAAVHEGADRTVARGPQTNRHENNSRHKYQRRGRDDDRQRATNAGFDQHMIKPVNPEELEAFLSNYRP
jgi:hypothetical protein